MLRRMSKVRCEKVAFLDRDGVINEKPNPHEYVLRWEEFRFRPQAITMLKHLQSEGYRLAVITNQQGVGKELMSRGDLDDIHARMKAVLFEHGVTIDGVFACTHLESDRCVCRKPQPGLFYRAMNELDYVVDLQASMFIGDSPSDREAASAFGVRWLHVDQT
jgi:histidinol-phosphate phosphatase family protein